MDGIDANDLHLSLWSGKLELTDVKVKEDVLGLLGIEGREKDKKRTFEVFLSVFKCF